MGQTVHIGTVLQAVRTHIDELMEAQHMRNQQPTVEHSPYLSPKELSKRWRCSRSSVDRIARQAGLTRLLLGEGTNGMVRYLRKEIVALEKTKMGLIRFLRTFELKEVDMPTYPKVFQGLKDRSQACPQAYCIMDLGFVATAM